MTDRDDDYSRSAHRGRYRKAAITVSRALAGDARITIGQQPHVTTIALPSAELYGLCWDLAGAVYHVDPDLLVDLLAHIAEQELAARELGELRGALADAQNRTAEREAT